MTSSDGRGRVRQGTTAGHRARPFAGGGRYGFFIERVDLRLDNGAANRAIARWKRLEREGWDVTALGDVGDTHLVGLGCQYIGQLELKVSA